MVNVHHNISSLQPYIPFGFDTKSQVWQNPESITLCWFAKSLSVSKLNNTHRGCRGLSLSNKHNNTRFWVLNKYAFWVETCHRFALSELMCFCFCFPVSIPLQSLICYLNVFICFVFGHWLVYLFKSLLFHSLIVQFYQAFMSLILSRDCIVVSSSVCSISWFLTCALSLFGFLTTFHGFPLN